MPLEKLNAALIGAIQNSTPEYTNAATVLTDKLNIGREAAYRRLRGEVPFTFGEAGVLSAQMNFSLDRTVGAVDFGNVLFRLSFNDYSKALEDYTGVIDQDTLFYREISSDADAEQAIAGNSFPRMIYMRYEKLTTFKLFKWLYQQGLVGAPAVKYEDMKAPEVLLQSYRDLVHEAQLMPATTLVFDRSCTKRWANAIGAFRNMHLITDESVEVLKAELLQMLDELEEICASGQFRSGQPVSVYISDMDIEATYCYLSARHYRASCIDTFSINSLRSADPHMFEHMKRWIMSLSRFASLISCSGELQRIHFFKRQRAIVAELEREGLEPSPEVFQE